MYIVIGNLGVGTDIVNACIDPTDIELIPQPRYITPSIERNVLTSNEVSSIKLTSLDYLKKIDGVELKYKSLETWLSKKNIEKHSNKHKYIFVDNSSDKELEWTKHHLFYAGRLPEVFPERNIKNFSVIEKYVCDFTITLEEILTGQMIERLSTFVTDVKLDEKLYMSWLTLINYDTPYK